ncbi:hypothetical protein D3C76_1344960 [compost metagenome]
MARNCSSVKWMLSLQDTSRSDGSSARRPIALTAIPVLLRIPDRSRISSCGAKSGPSKGANTSAVRASGFALNESSISPRNWPAASGIAVS